MGNIVSKVKNYFNSQMNSCKEAARNKVNNIKQSILNNINRKKEAVINKISSAANNVVTCVKSTKDDIIGAVVSVKNSVVGKITRTRNRICDTGTNIKNSIVSRIISVRDGVVGIKNAITDTAYSTRNRIVQSYVDVNNRTRSRYRKIRDAKLTKWQKIKYSLSALVLFFIFYFHIATAVNLYTGDYEQIEERFATIWKGTSIMIHSSYDVTLVILTFTWQSLCFLGQNLWTFIQVAWSYSYDFLAVTKYHLHEGSKEMIMFLSRGGKTFATYVWLGLKEAGCYTAIAASFIADYAVQWSGVAYEHGKCGAIAGYQYGIERSKVGFHYLKEGTSYLYHHGSITLKECGLKLWEFLIYFATDFRHASSDAFAWLWENGQVAAISLLSACHEATLLSFNFLLKSAATTYRMSFDLAGWMYDASFLVADAITTGLVDLAYKLQDFYFYSCLYLYDFFAAFYSTTVDVSTSVYKTAIAVCQRSYCWTVWIADAIIVWTSYIYDMLQTFCRDHGSVWLTKICTLLMDLGKFLIKILTKFFSDLIRLVSQFVLVTFERIYFLLSFIFILIYNIISLVHGFIKLLLSGLVFCIKGIFGGIVWLLAFTGKTYISFLNCYNDYREIIFFSFLGLLSIYCAGIAKDRNDSYRKMLSKNREHDEHKNQATKTHDNDINEKPDVNTKLSEKDEVSVLFNHEVTEEGDVARHSS